MVVLGIFSSRWENRRMSNPDGATFLQKLLSLRLGGSASGLRRRSDLHLARKFFHMSGAAMFLAPYLFLGFSRESMAAILGTVLAVVMSVEYARSRWEWVNSVAVKVMGPVMRDSEVNQLTGIPFYMASCLFAFLIFPRHVTILAILYLALGDPSSSFPAGKGSGARASRGLRRGGFGALAPQHRRQLRDPGSERGIDGPGSLERAASSLALSLLSCRGITCRAAGWALKEDGRVVSFRPKCLAFLHYSYACEFDASCYVRAQCRDIAEQNDFSRVLVLE
ncbi:hypothetical protein EB061_13340, partial [bacterium]|nr:hypothetical protein [bacterium]